MPQLEILVCGAGIAGPTLAFWLARAGNKVTVIERASEIRDAGLGVDIRGPAVEVVRRMGLEDQIRSRTTGEEGLVFVDSNDRTFAAVPVDQANLEKSITSEIEIMRSDLAQPITTAALGEQNVKIKYGTSLESVSQDELKVHVGFTNGKSATFDMVVAADGLGSTSRKLLLGKDFSSEGFIHSLGQYTAYFTIPHEQKNGMVWKWHNTTGSRILSTRPKNSNSTYGFLMFMPKDDADFRKVTRLSIMEQKERLAALFRGAGWQAPRLLSAMQSADDFYLQLSAQVKLPSWHSGRCGLVGDAAYCPLPLSGVGTSLAILGAYVLAGEMAKSNNDPGSAFRAYEKKLRPYVERKQKLFPGLPRLIYPSSA